MERKQILLVTAEKSLTSRLVSGLTHYGYTVVHFETGSKGLEFANTSVPGFILADLQLPDMDGIELCWMIRETSKVPDIPFMLLTNSNDPEIRINGFRSGADAFMQQSGSIREIVTRIETLWRRIKPASKSQVTRYASLCGNLPDFSLMEVFQFLNMTRKSGTLTIESAENVGKIGIENGNLTWAEQDLLESENAIFEIALWQQGSFKFEKDILFAKKNISKSTMDIILSCCNLIDEKRAEKPPDSTE
ncbi:response regulator [candidate division KSB1 bacterium]|nr:response regulator [candidate division KSB1 bacterium]